MISKVAQLAKMIVTAALPSEEYLFNTVNVVVRTSLNGKKMKYAQIVVGQGFIRHNENMQYSMRELQGGKNVDNEPRQNKA